MLVNNKKPLATGREDEEFEIGPSKKVAQEFGGLINSRAGRRRRDR
jgi:hypothetical protein